MKETLIYAPVVRGLQAASGLGYGSIGSIAEQKPFFKSSGVKRVDSLYNGTINLDIAPRTFKILKPDYEITAEWRPGTTETFWLVEVAIEYKGRTYPGYIYYPLPSPLKGHPDTIIEILAEKIDSLEYGDMVTVKISEASVAVESI